MTFLNAIESEFKEYLEIAGAIGMIVFVIQMIGPMLSGDTVSLVQIAADKIVSSVLIGAFASLILAFIGALKGIF